MSDNYQLVCLKFFLGQIYAVHIEQGFELYFYHKNYHKLQ